MTSSYQRDRLNDLISDSSSFGYGQHFERERVQKMIDARLDELHEICGFPQYSAVRQELLRLREALDQC